MLVLRNTSLVACLLILFFSATLITEAQSEATSTATTTETNTETEVSTTSTPTFPPETTSQSLQTNRPISGRLEQTRQQLDTRVQDRITNLAANISNRFDAAIQRFVNLANRLDSRMEKLRRNGVDTSAAETELGNARRLLDTAKDKMNNIDQLVYGAVTSEDPGAAWPTVRQTLRDVREDLLRVQERLRQVVRLLKAAIETAEGPEGSSSATVINASPL